MMPVSSNSSTMLHLSTIISTPIRACCLMIDGPLDDGAVMVDG
jgi:hypothetical protein